MDNIEIIVLQNKVEELKEKIQCLEKTLTFIYSYNKLLCNACGELVKLEESGANHELLCKEILYLKEIKDIFNYKKVLGE